MRTPLSSSSVASGPTASRTRTSASSAAMAKLRRDVLALARTSLPMLLLGETGTGKSALAERVVHPATRRKGPFVAIDLASIPESIAASELFGTAGEVEGETVDEATDATEDATAEGADAAAGPTDDAAQVADADTDASDPASPSSQVEADATADTEVVGAPDSTSRA